MTGKGGEGGKGKNLVRDDDYGQEWDERYVRKMSVRGGRSE